MFPLLHDEIGEQLAVSPRHAKWTLLLEDPMVLENKPLIAASLGNLLSGEVIEKYWIGHSIRWKIDDRIYLNLA